MKDNMSEYDKMADAEKFMVQVIMTFTQKCVILQLGQFRFKISKMDRFTFGVTQQICTNACSRKRCPLLYIYLRVWFVFLVQECQIVLHNKPAVYRSRFSFVEELGDLFFAFGNFCFVAYLKIESWYNLLYGESNNRGKSAIIYDVMVGNIEEICWC